MNKVVMGLFLMLATNAAIAGDAENISACVKKAKEFSGVTLDAFDVSYKGNVLSMSVAKWSNAICEVKVGQVYNLDVNGTNFIYQGYAGKESYDLNEELERKTDAAIDQMNSRISLLKQRKNQVSVSLQRPNPNHPWLTQYINEGIEKSVGKQN
jgi:hypothetical protein